jgi:hypothetical protein
MLCLKLLKSFQKNKLFKKPNLLALAEKANSGTGLKANGNKKT